ncbi:hypothetical protein BLOT_010625 [Blomia tropicalis]|nr:hypothetical protein BLOT_010625 [Blomia tropicalis]
MIDSIAFCGMLNLPSGPFTGVTSTFSHAIGTLADANICCTAADISGPIPSPGINVTVVVDSDRICPLLIGDRVHVDRRILLKIVNHNHKH